MELLGKFKEFIQTENLFQLKDRLLLAVSGGVDSVALCELCKLAGYDFVIAHCNFQLRGDESARDEKFVRNLADKYGVPFFLKIFDTKGYAANSKKSIEEAARDLRYEWFHSFVIKKDGNGSAEELAKSEPRFVNYILTGHHADDNIETVMMNFFRGTGITGLRGILPKQGNLIRPLLFARRTDLERFVKAYQLDFVTDYTNLENDYTRNFFRNAIIPLVSESFPNATNNLLKNIQRFKETDLLYQQAIQLHKKKILEVKGTEVHMPVLKLLKTVPLATVVYEIIKDYGFTSHQTEEAIALLKSETGKYIQSATHRVIKNRNWLIIAPIQAVEAEHILIEEKDVRIHFKDGTIAVKKSTRDHFTLINNPLIAQLDFAELKFPLLLRKSKTGDYFYPLGMQKKKKLSRFFIDQKLSLTQKEHAWVIEMDKKIIWVIGMRLDDRFKIRESTQQIYTLQFLNSNTGDHMNHSLK
jgi:tRNA(Ile)-lysidine synthase